MLDPKGMEAAREAWIASDVATRFFSDVEHCALEAAITAYLATLPQEPAPEPVGWFNPWDDYHGYQQVAKEYEGTPGTIPLYASPVASPPVSEDAVERIERIICDAMNGDPRGGSFSRAAHAVVTAFSAASIPAGGVKELPENILEDAAKSAFVKAQSVYRADHDHFPLKTTWETTSESVREGWRGIAYAAVEAAYMPPLGTQPEPRQPRDVASALSPSPVGGRCRQTTISEQSETDMPVAGERHDLVARLRRTMPQYLRGLLSSDDVERDLNEAADTIAALSHPAPERAGEALREVFARWCAGYGFSGDSDEDTALYRKVETALSAKEAGR